MTKHRIVVSAENNPYMEWQCKLFYFSCVTRLKQQPLIIVHDSGKPWCSGFYDLVRAGCAVYPAPSYRTTAKGVDYPGRNQPGSLIQAAQHLEHEDGFIILCDPDIIFTGTLEFPATLSGEFSAFMDYDSDFVNEALAELRIERSNVNLREESLRCSVPYVIPVADAHRIGKTWLNALDAFRAPRWEENMYAFGLGMLQLDLRPVITNLAVTNHRPDDEVRVPIIHYAYGDDRWNKRNYFTFEQAKGVWETQIEITEGTILGELLSQIRQAKNFYRDPYALRSSSKST
jgi:hypothetical protein